MEEIDIYRSARLLLDKFEDDALAVANQRIASFEKLRNEEAISVWRQIKAAIEWELLQNPIKQMPLQ